MTFVAKSNRKPPPATAVEKWWVVATAWGYCAMVWRDGADDSGRAARPGHAVLLKIVAAQRNLSALCRQMRRDFPQAQRQRGHLRPARRLTNRCNRVVLLAQFLRDYYASDRGGSSWDASIWAQWRPHLEMGGLSNFAQSVLRLTTRIPPGRTLTYGELAANLGQPGAARAVGGALAANPFPILIPCHRVLGKSGQLTGFSAPGGVATKKAMLEREAKLTGNGRRGSVGRLAAPDAVCTALSGERTAVGFKSCPRS